MCGIVGIASKEKYSDRDLLKTMARSMEHRGPDDAGQWWSNDQRVGLAHCRLSILDLSSAGHQPMSDKEEQYVITFNGEIYNYLDLRDQLISKGYIFHTQSDTEVLLTAYKAWGTNCLNRLNGMFSFCIYDIRERILFLGRDRIGEKPLFYTHQEGFFTFASELKALMACAKLPRTIDLKSMRFYFTYGYIPGEHCILKGFYKLPPGHALTFDLSSQKMRTWKYWDIPEPSENKDISIDQLSCEMEKLLEDSVRRQLVADVPVGILLSGGIDSSLITAMAARVSSKPVKTYTVAFPGEISYNEGPYANIVASHFATDHTELEAEPASEDLLYALAAQYDEPMCDSSMIPTYLVSKAIRQSAKVALGGDGGDELFGGYLSYNWIFKQDLLRKIFPLGLRKLGADFSERFLPLGVRGRNFLLALNSDLPYAFSQMNSFFGGYPLEQLIPAFRDKSSGQQDLAQAYKRGLCQKNRGIPGMFMALDLKTYLPEDILVKVDRASMLNSLEIRAPFLDHRIVEFAFSRVPNTLKANVKSRKILLKALAKRILPSRLELDRKQGFSIPLKKWFKSEFGKFIEKILVEADPGLFDQKQIRRLINDQKKGLINGERLFSLTLFELWRRKYKVGIDK